MFLVGVAAWSGGNFSTSSILLVLVLVLVLVVVTARGMRVGVTLSKDGLRIYRMIGSRCVSHA